MRRTKKDILSKVSGVKRSRFVDHNTLEIFYEDGTRAIRLHDTDIIKFCADTIVFNSGGWKTPTQKDRINKFAEGFQVNQENGVWYISKVLKNPYRLDKTYEFYDGMVFDYEKNLLTKEHKTDMKERERTKRKIRKYVKLITEDNLPFPENGDCWDCLMKDDNGVTMGDLNGSHSHLWYHLEEGYIHGSILVNAMKEKGFTDQQIAIHYHLKIVDTFRRAVRKYLQKRLLK